MSISKMVQIRLSMHSTIQAAIEHHRAHLATELHSTLAPYLRSDETLSKHNVELVLALLGRHFEAVSKTMRSVDEEHSQELGEDVVARQQLEDAIEEAYQGLRDLKLAIRNAYGKELLEELQIHGTTPVDYQKLSQQYGRVIKWLSEDTKNFPPKTGMFSIELSKPDILTTLLPLHLALEDAIIHYKQDKRETESTMLEKNQTITEYDKAESQVTKILEGLLNMIGLEEEARRLKPKRRKNKENPNETNTAEEESTQNTSAPSHSTSAPA